MVTVCLTCGDEGIRNALIYCDHCQIYAIHRYCLFVLPKNLNGAVVWFCEDCELERDVKSSSVGQCDSESLECVEESNKSDVRCFEKKEDTSYLLSKQSQICGVSQPMQEPIWRGSVNISNEKIATCDGLVAHLSTLACARVLEQARMLPGLLSPDILPRTAVWPKSFAKSPPSHDSIGLYIFSDNKRSEKGFDNLVLEMTHLDLALKGVVQNTEILIFSSTLLPVDYCRFQGNLYLWGVFKKKKTISTLINSNPGDSFMNSPSC